VPPLQVIATSFVHVLFPFPFSSVLNSFCFKVVHNWLWVRVLRPRWCRGSCGAWWRAWWRGTHSSSPSGRYSTLFTSEHILKGTMSQVSRFLKGQCHKWADS
jgi:hypothetical protein